VKTKISAITVVSLSAALFVIGCGTTKETTTRESESRTNYVTAAPLPQVAIVQPAAIAVVPPTTTTTSMSNDRSSDSSGMGGSGSSQSSSAHHSESTTVTPSN